jgi:hypothetical protein
MTNQPGPDLPGALAALAIAFRGLGCPAMLIGGLAVIARGVPRQTIDIDAVVQGEGLDVESLCHLLERSGFIPRIPDAMAFARQRQVLLMRHAPSGIPLDLSLGWLPFECDAMARATPVDLAGVTLPVATAEDLVVFKAVAWRDRDKGDIERLVIRHGDTFDFTRMRATLAQFYEALDEPERLQEFETLVKRALASRGA